MPKAESKIGVPSAAVHSTPSKESGEVKKVPFVGGRNTGVRWTKDDEAHLKTLLVKKTTWSDIVRITGRSDGAVKYRAVCIYLKQTKAIANIAKFVPLPEREIRYYKARKMWEIKQREYYPKRKAIPKKEAKKEPKPRITIASLTEKLTDLQAVNASLQRDLEELQN